MRIAKGIVGWLAFLSLLASIFFTGYWLYATIMPWFKGGGIATLPPPDVSAMAKTIGTRGLNGMDLNAELKKYATQEVTPEQVLIGIEAVDWVLSHGRIPASNMTNNVAAAAVLDPTTRVIAAYPKVLIGYVPGTKHPLSDMEDNPTTDRYPYWKSVFRMYASQFTDDTGDVYMTRAIDPSGKTIALLVTVAKRDLTTILPPPSQAKPIIAPRTAVYAAIISFLLYLLLLPIWVGMDASWRGMRPSAWGILVLITNVIGLGGYLIARLPAPRTCPNCGERVLGKYVRCPACGVSLRTGTCPICKAPMKPGWQYCPVCSGVPVATADKSATVAPPAALGQGSLRICALDSDTGTPIPNARVTIKGPCTLEGLANIQGAFEARKLKGGKYTVRATRYGFEQAEAELEIDELIPETVQLKLRPLPGRVVGRVVEAASQKPIAGAKVCIDSSRLDRSAETGADGGFVLDDIPAGPYTVSAEIAGFTAQTKLVEAAPGEQAALDFALEKAAEA